MRLRNSNTRRLIAAFWLLHGSVSLAQSVEGLVYDAQSGEAMSYVNIYKKGGSSGSVSMTDGTYRLDLFQYSVKTDSVEFSIIGYKKKTLSVAQLIANPKVGMNASFVNLETALVSPKSPEEYIQMAIDNIPDNYITEPYNGLIYLNTVIRLNGKFIESSEALVKGYIMPIPGKVKDSTRLKMLAFKQFDEEEQAVGTIIVKKRKKEKAAITGLDSMLLDMTDEMSKHFGIYTQIDSNLIKQAYLKGYKKEKEKLWFESVVPYEGRNLIKIGFSAKDGLAKERGNVLLDEESLAFEKYNIQIGTAAFKLKMLLLVFGIGFKKAEAVVQFSSLNSEQGWTPDLFDLTVFIDMEKNRLFAKDIPIVLEIKSRLKFLDVEYPASDACISGDIIKKNKALRDQFKSDPDHPLWKKYKNQIE